MTAARHRPSSPAAAPTRGSLPINRRTPSPQNSETIARTRLLSHARAPAFSSTRIRASASSTDSSEMPWSPWRRRRLPAVSAPIMPSYTAASDDPNSRVSSSRSLLDTTARTRHTGLVRSSTDLRTPVPRRRRTDHWPEVVAASLTGPLDPRTCMCGAISSSTSGWVGAAIRLNSASAARRPTSWLALSTVVNPMCRIPARYVLS
jgi:hypothetical protein